MRQEARKLTTAAERASFVVRRLSDHRTIVGMLQADRAFSAYALGHLDDGFYERSRFWSAEGPSGTGLVLLANAVGPTMVTVGDPDAVAAVLAIHPGERVGYLSTAAPEHMAAVARWHHVDEPLYMQRMSLERPRFAFVDGGTTVRRLTAADAPDVNALYATDGRPGQYRGTQIEQALYFGSFEGAALVSVAGTHVISPMFGVGVVGNVMTHPAYRGRGLATRVTSRVTAALLDAGCELVVLTVDPSNTPAVRAYRRLGFVAGASIVEAHLRRRDPSGIASWLRRLRAERRSDGAVAVTIERTRDAHEA